MQRYLGVIAAFAALAMTTALAGCGSTGGSGDVTIRLVAADYGNGPDNASGLYWTALAKEFEKKNPGIKVKVDVRSWKTVDADVATMVKQGKAPDIAQVGSYADYAKDDRLYKAGDLLSIPTQSNFLTQLGEAGKVGRVQYGMPFVASTRLLFYNKSLFEDAGLDAPTSWDDIEADAKALKQKGVRTPFALPLGSEESQAETMMWALSGGGGFTATADNSYSIDSAENVMTFRWLKQHLVDAGLTGPVAPGKLDRAAAFKSFTDGKVGMLDGHPTLMLDAEKKGIKVGTVPLPGPHGAAKSSMGVADWVMAFKQNGHGDEAGKFLDFAYDDKNVLDFTGQYNLLPVTYSANAAMAADPKYQALSKFQAALPTSELYPFGKSSWSAVSERIKTGIGKAVAPGADPAAVLGDIAQAATVADAAR